ncbi:ATP-binding protein [Scytonema hofmannii]|uniref:ATP-binding protein n=1 Tax=Scytonema hofmannii TaxID=34078 RepID=UPI0003452620|nr:ATP-binding protein [Scytonema hofmannii]
MSTSLPPPSQYSKAFQQVVREKSRNFVGRDFVFRAIADFLQNYNRGYFTIVGYPGSGKSAILAQYVTQNPQVIYYNAEIEGKNCAGEFFKDVYQQIVPVKNGSLHAKHTLREQELDTNVSLHSSFHSATEGSGHLSLLLQRTSDQLEPHQKLIVVIDALDRVSYSDQIPGSNIFYLPRYLPEKVYVVLARRPFLREKSGLLIEAPFETLNLSDFPEQNRQDLCQYIQYYLSLSPSLKKHDNLESSERLNLKSWLLGHHISGAEFCDRLTAESENNFMYLSQTISSITNSFYAEPLQHHQLPPSLEIYYQQHWEKMTNEGLSDIALEVLRVLTATEQGISVEAISQILDRDEYDVEEVLENWFEFLQTQQIGEETCYSFYHSNFRRWLGKQLHTS